uniref:Lipase domain-containing protein n=1 Tax=Heterorhabditis bacteriophora TaxID=37862 RepID=A0A1I7XCX9_HETBA
MQFVDRTNTELCILINLRYLRTTKQEDLQFVVASLNERLNALEGEKKKLEVDLASKLAENEEVKFRLNLLTPTVEKATSRVTKLTEERDALKEQIAKLEAEVVSKSVPPASISLTSVASNMPNSERTVLDSEVAMAASIPKRIAFDSPVRSIPITTSRTPMPQVSQPTIQGASVTIASYPTVPKLFKTTTSSSLFIPQTTSSPVRLSDNINTTIPTEVSTPQSITFSFATSSAAPRISPGQSLFGKSAPVPATNVTTSSSANTTREELIDQAVVTEAEQSSQVFFEYYFFTVYVANTCFKVSGSVEAAADEVVDDDGMAQNGMSITIYSAGESRDSTAGMPVSSSDGSRKRPAPDVEASDAKRQRDSPSEIVTSSEERKDIQRGTLELDEPDVVEDNDVEEIDDGVEQEPLSDEDVSEHDMEEFEDDEGDDDEEDGGANDADGGDDEVVVLSGESDDEEEDVGEIEEDDDGGNDDEVLGADENLQSQPSLEDQDREAASAVEEADDEGRESANIRPSTATSAPASSDAPRLRIPIVYDRDDQCSSSNETGAVPQRLGLPVQRQTARRARPVRAIYQRDRLARRDIGPQGSYGGGSHQGGSRTSRQAVILVHGITNTAGTFNGHRNHFLGVGWGGESVYGTTYGDGGKTPAPLVDMKCDYIKQIRWMIQSAASFTRRKVDIVGYSMGSPISRKAILGGLCVDTGENLGPPLTGLVDTFVSVAGANHGSYLCIFPLPGACNPINGLSCHSHFIQDINSRHRYEGKFIYSIYSMGDDKVGYRNGCGQVTSSIVAADKQFERPGNHDEVMVRTAQLQINLVDKHDPLGFIEANLDVG